MNRRGRDNVSPEGDESSGVTRLAPVPVKPIRLRGLDENDRTQYFSVTNLMERGKAVAARLAQANEGITSGPSEVPRSAPPPAPPERPGILRQFRQASLVRQASAVLLPVLALLLLLEPVLRQPPHKAASTPTTAVATRPAVATTKIPTTELAATPAAPPPALQHGVTLERAATDAVASGDFERAQAFYRELTRQHPSNAAYREALRILELRARRP